MVAFFTVPSFLVKKQAMKGWDSNLALMVPTWPGHLQTGLSPLLIGPRIPREAIPSAVLTELLDVTEP